MKNALLGRALPLLATFLLAVGMLLGSFLPAYAAEERKALAFDETPVLDDLAASTDAEGNPFDLTDYPYNDYGSVQLITFAEYCYGYAANLRNNYGLYLYLYNPQALHIDTASPLNKVQLAVAWDEDGEPAAQDKFELLFCNKSGGDYEGLFYKFRVLDKTSSYDGKTIAERVNSNGRKYSITGVELLTDGDANATDYGVGGMYTYTGYAAGYGADADAESTLACAVTPFETVELDVHHTYYRAEGDYYMGKQTQLDSVFFNVPKRLYEEYGELYEIACEWHEYKTNPALVTESLSVYNALLPYIGKDVSEIEGMTVAMLGFGNATRNWLNTTFVTPLQSYTNIPEEALKDKNGNWKDLSQSLQWDNIFGFKVLKLNKDLVEATMQNRFGALSDVIFAGGEATDYSASAEEVKARLLELSAQLGGEKINGKYAAALFSDEVDEGHTRGYSGIKTITKDTDMILTEYTTELLSHSWWSGAFHVSESYKLLKAIHTVEAADLDGDDAEVAARLYIAEEDVPLLRTEFAEGLIRGENTVLFRFSTSTYDNQYAGGYILPDGSEYPPEAALVAAHKTLFEFTESNYDETKFNSVLISETVYLDFDVISLTFRDEEQNETVLPVVASPIDAIGGYTPPLDTNYHGGDSTWIWVVIAVVLGIVLILLLIFCPQVFVILFKAIFFVISLPFRAVAALVKAIQKSRADKPKKDKPPKDKPGGGGGGKTENPAQRVEIVVRAEQPAPRKKYGEKNKKISGDRAQKITAKRGEKTNAAMRAGGKNVTTKKKGGSK